MTDDAGKNVSEETEAEALWDFANALYAGEGVAAACLDLQEHWGVDVNLLLYSVWCGCRDEALDSEGLRAAAGRCAPWREAIVLPLRRQRQLWQGAPPFAAEYAAVKDLELAAERVQLRFLAVLPRPRAAGSAQGGCRVRRPAGARSDGGKADP